MRTSPLLLLLLLCLALLAPVPAWAQEDCWDLDCEENQPEPCDPWLDADCPAGGCTSCMECAIDYESPGYLFFCECMTKSDGYVNCIVSGDGTSCDNFEKCYYT